MGFNNNDDDFDFDDDLFADDDDPFADDDLFGDSGDDLFADDGDNFAFGEDEFDADNFDDVDLGLPGEEEEIIIDEEGPDSGTSGGFRTSLFVLVPLLLVQIGVILFLFLRPMEDGPFEMTSTAVFLTNEAIFVMQTDDAQTLVAQAGTQTAEAEFTDTPSPSPTELDTETPTPSPSPTATETLDPTLVAVLTLDAQETADALALTEAAQTEAAAATDTPEGGLTNADRDATATALVDLFNNLTQTAEARGVTTDVPMEATVAASATALPDSGFFDNSGTPTGSGLGMLVLTAFGLLGVIAFSRRMRAQNRELD